MTSLSFQKLHSDACYENCLANKEMSLTNCAHCIEKCVDHISEVPSSSDGEVKILSGTTYIYSIDHEDERRRHISETFVN
jgi:hypothetical protein